MGNQPDYDDGVERRNTHPLALPKAKAEGIISKQDINVLRHTIGPAEDQEHTTGVKSKSIYPPLNSGAGGPCRGIGCPGRQRQHGPGGGAASVSAAVLWTNVLAVTCSVPTGRHLNNSGNVAGDAVVAAVCTTVCVLWLRLPH